MAWCSIRARCSTRSSGCKEQGVDGDAGQPAHRRERDADPAAAPGARRRARAGVRQGRDRHHRSRHRPGLRGQGRPPRDPPDGSRRPADARRQDRAPAGASQCAAARPRHGRGRAAHALRRARGGRAQGAARTWTRCGRCSTRSGARASASCSRARRARCSISTTAPIRSSPRPTRWRRRRRLARAWARTRSAMCSASARPIRRASAPGRSRPSSSTTIGKTLGTKGKEFGIVTGRPRRCGWFDAVLVRQTVRTSGIQGIALTKLDILDGFRRDQGLRRLPPGRPRDRLSSGERARAGPG